MSIYCPQPSDSASPANLAGPVKISRTQKLCRASKGFASLVRFHESSGLDLPAAQYSHGFRAPALWEKERQILKRRLRALVAADFGEKSPLDKSFGDAPRTPYRQESPFARDGGALELEVAAGIEPLRVRGFIDRIDRQGDGVILVDYKTGSTTIPVKEMERGRNFQMMLYLLAAQRILEEDTAPDAPGAVTGGAFWHIGTRARSCSILLDESVVAAMQEAREHLGRYITAGRAGDFAVHPNRLEGGRCAHYCDFSQFCRVGITHRYKREK